MLQFDNGNIFSTGIKSGCVLVAFVGVIRTDREPRNSIDGSSNKYSCSEGAKRRANWAPNSAIVADAALANTPPPTTKETKNASACANLDDRIL